MTALEKTSTDDALAVQSSSSLRGVEKGLLFLLSLDEAIATPILARLTPEEIVELRKATESLKEVNATSIARVHTEFTRLVKTGVPASLQGSGAYLRRIAGKVLGEGRVSELWQERDESEGPIAKLSRLDVKTLLPLIANEKPQTLAVLFSQFDPGRASEILAKMPLATQAEVVLRMSRLGAVSETVLEEIEQQFAVELEALGDDARRSIEGSGVAANVVKRFEAEQTEILLEELAKLDPEAAEEIRGSLFTFEDLLRIEGRGIQALLKEVATDKLVVAMKNASDDIKEKILGNVSSRMAVMLREELENLGPVRLSDVEEAQAEIISAALRLSNDGAIVIAREGGGDFV